MRPLRLQALDGSGESRGSCPGQEGQRGTGRETTIVGVFYHSLWLPVRHRGVGLNGGTFPQQVCADRGDACREAVTQWLCVSPEAAEGPRDTHTHLAGAC